MLVLLGLDLYLSSRRGHGERFREAIGWSVFWIVLSLAFGAWLWLRYGDEAGLEFFAGYLLEKSLSVDNLFVFVLLFQSFAIPPEYQHRVLFWGVLGALILRGGLILAGVALVHRFRWVIAIFGAILVYTAAVFAVTDDSFLVFSSNVCALLGLRALYFVVRGALARVRYLKPGLAAILLFVGLKMLFYRWVHLPTGTSLAIIGGILAVAIAVSWLRPAPPE